MQQSKTTRIAGGVMLVCLVVVLGGVLVMLGGVLMVLGGGMTRAHVRSPWSRRRGMAAFRGGRYAA